MANILHEISFLGANMMMRQKHSYIILCSYHPIFIISPHPHPPTPQKKKIIINKTSAILIRINFHILTSYIRLRKKTKLFHIWLKSVRLSKCAKNLRGRISLTLQQSKMPRVYDRELLQGPFTTSTISLRLLFLSFLLSSLFLLVLALLLLLLFMLLSLLPLLLLSLNYNCFQFL